MPARDDDRMFSIRFLQNAMRVFFSNLMPETDDCIVWPGNAEHGCPIIRTTIGTASRNLGIMVRPALAPWADRDDGSVVLMRCATAMCINPKHMLRANNGRPRNIGQPRNAVTGKLEPKVPAPEAEEVIKRLGAGMSQSAVAAEFGLSQSTISRIARRK